MPLFPRKSAMDSKATIDRSSSKERFKQIEPIDEYIDRDQRSKSNLRYNAEET
jgi:hypothetical protein